MRTFEFMKMKRKWCGIALLGLISASTASAQHSARLVDHPTYNYAEGSFMTLGKGLDVAAPLEERSLCGSFTNYDSEGETAQETSILASVVRSTEDVKRKLDIDMRLSARVLIVSSQLEMAVRSNFESSQNSVVVAITAKSIFGRRMTRDFRLLPQYAEILRTPFGQERFRSICGTHYISTEVRGASMVVLLRINNLSQNEKQEITGALEGGVNLGVFSANLSGNVNSTLSRRISSGQYSLSVLAIGGEGISQFAQLSAGLTVNPNNVAGSIREGLQTAMSRFRFGNSVPVSFVASPYLELTNVIPDFVSDEKEAALTEIAHQVRRWRGYIDAFRSRLIEARDDSDFLLLRTIDSVTLAAARAQLPQARDYLNRLVATHHACARSGEQNWQTACSMPALPEMTHLFSVISIMNVGNTTEGSH